MNGSFDFDRPMDLDGGAKTYDPISSVEAGCDAVASGTAVRHRNIIMAAMSYAFMTNMQISQKSGLNQNQVTRRMTELERRGVVVRGGFVKCPILKRKVGSWRLV